MSDKPVLIELEAAPASPAEAPPVPEAAPEGRAMQAAVRIAARPPSRLGRFFWQAAAALVGFLASVAAWRFVEGLFAANPVLGWVATGLFGAFLLAAALLAARELAAFARLKRLDRVHKAALVAADSGDLAAARRVVAQVSGLYAGRAEFDWARARLKERGAEELDADTLLRLAETELMAPIDAAARREVEAAARIVATTTALVPLALADVFAALTANLRMIRRVAELYGGRAGSLGSLRLARAVMTHLVATGAVAAGDDLIETVTGGHLFSKLSRRFGEGVVNGALTARVGLAAIEVCRPLPFRALARPRVTNLTSRALTGLFSREKSES
ncbi:TIGR01620 family protein [Rhodobacter xanthinilyticus]|uniref:TIGR01620 family protein n=1 Tax=Rhodobacter xanthinilyticus TaxID=1850250 RepID=A0A1D9MF39_9RHOB|nr:TIGR01620 family protein [Rhodobacter xanthinilyticus]AOZ70388.1 TIGR01620 family protein [Rhodobacter xanthinilyticus]